MAAPLINESFEDSGDPFYDAHPDAFQWVPELAEFDELIPEEIRLPGIEENVSVTPAQFSEVALRILNEDGSGFAPFSFKGRRHMLRVYDTPARRILLVAARQVEKSTMLGNRTLCYSCLIPGFRTLYVSPTSTQTKTFSNDRIREPIETSPVLKTFTTTMLSQNVFEKQFLNFSKIVLRNAFLNADRCRGIPAHTLMLDEFQDILSDNVPVIEQCTAHSPEELKHFIYSGTPKSLDNNIEKYRSDLSTQGEWVVPCDACGSAAGAGRYWNVLGEKNIGKKGLICEKCGELIDAQHQDAQWAQMVAWDPLRAPFESYRVSQLMVPWKKWDEVLLQYRHYARDKFFNEVLGLSYDSGMRPLTTAQVRACSNPIISMHPVVLRRLKKLLRDTPIFAGLDHGTGEHSYTVVCLGAYIKNIFTIFYVHRCEQELLEIPAQEKFIVDLLTEWNVLVTGSDYGGGFHMNDHLTRAFGPARIAKFQYLARVKKKVEYDQNLRRFKVHRTEVMSDIFNAIKRCQIGLPRWAEFRVPYAQDMTNIIAEYNEQLRMIQYGHRIDRPDDTFHAILYCFLASMMKFPRPDIIKPLSSDMQHVGPVSIYQGPIEQ